MNLLGIGAIIDSVGKVVGDLHTSDKERMELELRGREIDQKVDLAQIEVNRAEAQHHSIFVAGWRPAIGWVGVAALAYQFLLYPLMIWVWTWGQGAGYIPPGLHPPPVIDSDQLWVVLSGVLGIATMRTYEKKVGVARQ